MNTIISIIIPCFNSEVTLGETLESVLNQKYQNWEAIIVNDGSTDGTEEIALSWVKTDNRFKYYTKENEGLGKTRNFAINESSGTFILPLDSDNQLEEDFVYDAICVFEKNCDVGVVYGDAEYFGERDGLWKVGQYDLKKMLVHNYIDGCTIYRKELWAEVGGYDESMPYQGHEDWEFWIGLGNLNVKFYYLNKITFKYYVSKDSMIRSFTYEMVVLNQDYIVKKHARLYHRYLCKEISKSNMLTNYFDNKLRSKKFVVDLFCNTFFSFTVFKSKLD